MSAISRLILYLLLTVAVIGDIKSYRISNRLILTGLGFAFLFRLVGGKVAGIIWFLPDIFFPVVVLYLLYLSGILGAGDIKLFSVICGFTNLKFIIVCMMASFLTAAAGGLVKMIASKEFLCCIYNGICYCKDILYGRFARYEKKGKTVSFSAYVLLGTVISDILVTFSF